MGTASIAMTSGCSVIRSPWKANSRTSVRRRAQIESGPSLPTTAWKCCAPWRSRIVRHSCERITGAAMYSATEVSKVSQGTLMDERPSSRATRGAKATTMMASLSATCDSVK